MSCNDDEYRYRHNCGLFPDKDAPVVVGKWDLIWDYRTYRVNTGKLDTRFAELYKAELKLCDDGFGTLDKDGNRLISKIEWQLLDDDHIVIHNGFEDETLGWFESKDTFRIMESTEDYQYWVDTSEIFTARSDSLVYGVSEWWLERR
jgi:hypothetical protein